MAVGTTQRAGVVNRATDFEQFYRRERAGLYRALALTTGDAELAREAVDEAMVRAYGRWRRVRDYDNPAGWVYRVALNWATSGLRRRARSVPVPHVGERAGADEPDPPDDRLARAVAGLPDHQRAVVVLRFHLDWSLDRIAAALDVPTGTVKSRLHRGLAAVRDTLEGDR